MAKKSIGFITVEGLEASGKSSVIAFLKRYLKKRGHSVCVLREPGSTVIGEKIRRILLDKKNTQMSSYTELLLYLAARTQLIEEKLKGAVDTYDFVICDRFFDSTLVYQGYALGLGAIAERAVKEFSLGLCPDLTFVLDAPVKKTLKRISVKDRIESRSVSFHNKLRRGYKKLAKQFPRRIRLVGAHKDLDEVCAQVAKICEEVFSL